MKVESFENHVDRVSRARHLMMNVLASSDYFSGIARGYRSSLFFLGGENEAAENIKGLAGYSSRISLTLKTKALVISDRVLTHREDSL